MSAHSRAGCHHMHRVCILCQGLPEQLYRDGNFKYEILSRTRRCSSRRSTTVDACSAGCVWMSALECLKMGKKVIMTGWRERTSLRV